MSTPRILLFDAKLRDYKYALLFIIFSCLSALTSSAQNPLQYDKSYQEGNIDPKDKEELQQDITNLKPDLKPNIKEQPIKGKTESIDPLVFRIKDLKQAGVSDLEIRNFISRQNKEMKSSELNVLMQQATELIQKEKQEEEGTFEEHPKNIYEKQKKGEVENLIYGMSMFRSASVTFEPVIDVVPPDDYRIGPGDEIVINVWGFSELSDSYVIERDGSIFPPSIGKIYLSGLTYKEMKDYVKNQYSQIVKGKIEVVLGKVRSINVNIVGEVFQPGTYTVSALSTVFNALYAAGGPSNIGSLRNIVLRRRGITMDTLDVYRYLIDADPGSEIYVENNDFIYIPVQKKVVQIKGQVKRPLAYEMLENESLLDLLRYSGGLVHTAYLKNVQIKRVEQSKEVLIDIALDKIFESNFNFSLRDGDIIEINRIEPGIINTIQAMGAFNLPGVYQVKEGDRVSDLLFKAQGYSSDAYLKRAYVLRITPDLDVKYIPINLENAVNFSLPDSVRIMDDVELRQFDAVQVFSKKDLRTGNIVTIKGLVNLPGEYDVSGTETMTLKDLLYLGGGLRPEAARNRIEVARIIHNAGAPGFELIPKQVLIKTIPVQWDLSIDKESESFILNPYDIVYVRKNPDFKLQRNITIDGEVLYPGEYTLLSETERVSSLVERSGGLREYAYLKGAKLSRESVGDIVVDLEKALSEPGSKADIILKENDKLNIPTTIDVIKIGGEVQVPVTVIFDGNTSFRHQIAFAGGFMENANKKKSYVRYPNGTIKTTKHLFGIRKYPTVVTGAELMVPKKEPRKFIDTTKIQSTITYVATTMTSLLLILITIRQFQ